jgi:peroxiredoxin Q/BCP
MLKEGTHAPEFDAQDQESRRHKLTDYRGKWVLLYFYPKDNTPGCTVEACSLRDSYPDFQKVDAVIFGVSTDSIASHEKFAKKNNLPFTLLSDFDKKMAKAYEAGGLFRRISYLISPDGKIAKAYPKVNPKEHAAEVLKYLKAL